MWTVHKRIGELWYKHSIGKGLTEDDLSELKICLDANMRMVQKFADLQNLSYTASIIKDTEWQHEICAEIDKLHEKMGYIK